MSEPTAPVAGVQFASPPAELLPSILGSIDAAVKALPPGKTGALVGVANATGANVAIVAKLGEVWAVQAWVAKTWKGSTDYGAAVKASW